MPSSPVVVESASTHATPCAHRPSLVHGSPRPGSASTNGIQAMSGIGVHVPPLQISPIGQDVSGALQSLPEGTRVVQLLQLGYIGSFGSPMHMRLWHWEPNTHGSPPPRVPVVTHAGTLPGTIFSHGNASNSSAHASKPATVRIEPSENR
jgi:hypothetical protein